ncbi:hypothetical protein K7X08_032663 [Anisodus acutangulus]|uniref:Uncharacterized protein n=1 Tax=Anisodus acutangulus TaxID=402998 RepID=A0A9Q1MY73_9SOLA|nr:hypothetical protein K7X08_032663 [Anisodus acutangulus]
MMDYTRLEYVDHPDPIDTSVPASTSVPKVLAPTTEIVPVTSVATSSASATGPFILAHGVILIRLAKDKVTKLVEEFPSYIKEAIHTTLVPHKANLEAVREEQKSIRAQLQSIELRLRRIDGGGEKGLPAIRSELQRILAWMSALDPPEIVLARPILPPVAE